MRFRDLDTQARLVFAGSLAAVLAFFLPWFTVRLNLQLVDITGTGLATSPILFSQIGTPVAAAEAVALAFLALVALVCALGGFLLILAPAVSTMREMNPRGGQRFAVVGLAASVLAIVIMAALIGPQVGVTAITYGAALALVGFGLAAWAWPRAHRLGDEDDGHAGHAPPPGAGA